MQKKMTNYEKIKNLGIEDFTAWVSNLADCSNCTIRKCDGLCYTAWLNWLKARQKTMIKIRRDQI